MSQGMQEKFWSWYARSARSDGTSVSLFRRVGLTLLSLGLIVGWDIWTTRSNPKIAQALRNLTVAHPVFLMGIVLSFIAMSFRVAALNYMAFRIYEVEHVRFPRGIFGNETSLRAKYEQIFGKDSFRRAPELWGALSILLFFLSGLSVVFSR